MAAHMATAQQVQGGERLIRMPELLKLVGISRATAYRYFANGKLLNRSDVDLVCRLESVGDQ